METNLPDREKTAAATLPPLGDPREAPRWVAWLLAGDLDDDGSEPHICRGID
ncbi:hypothetical protein [Streptomyces sp. NPDC056600]|uniref:hypothetical protein n=1 Tax=Streptomyces sp. NPDC056600 TaxID=3345874 RepID=UPI0036954A23